MPGELCFVVMPFHRSRSAQGGVVDFGAVYHRIIKPAIERAEMRPHRADEELLGGVFHKTMFERLALCEYCIADLSLGNPNVFYELGIRHALRPWSTVLMFRNDAPLPLDVALDSAMSYPPDVLDDPRRTENSVDELHRRLVKARRGDTDSPVHQLVAGLPSPEVAHRRADAVVAAMERQGDFGMAIAEASRKDLNALRALLDSQGPPQQLDPESAVGLFLAFRGYNAWDDMVALAESMPRDTASVWLVREQYALALGRLKQFERAESILTAMIEKRPNAETLGILGGIYSRQWRAAVEDGKSVRLTRGLLERAAMTYLRGFECDLRDPYPGVSAVSLLRLAGMTAKAAEIEPIVRYAVRLRLQDAHPEYWDYACELHLAVNSGDEDAAEAVMPRLLTALTLPFHGESTSEGLHLTERHLPGTTPEQRAWIAEIRQEIEYRTAEVIRST